MGEDGAARPPPVRRHMDSTPDECKLFVGNLPTSFNEKVLSSIFEAFGTITHCTVMMDSSTGMSRGFGFVHFSSIESAKSAQVCVYVCAVQG